MSNNEEEVVYHRTSSNHVKVASFAKSRVFRSCLAVRLCTPAMLQECLLAEDMS